MQITYLLLQRSDGEEIHLEKQNEEERAINKKTKEVGRESVIETGMRTATQWELRGEGSEAANEARDKGHGCEARGSAGRQAS